MTGLSTCLLAAPAPATRPTDPSSKQQAALYFPAGASKPVRRIESGPFVVLTDSPDLPNAMLTAYLNRLHDQLQALGAATPTRQPTTQPANRPIVAALYANRERFQALWSRVGEHYGGRFFGIGRAGGYSYRVFCATYLNEDKPKAIPSELGHEMAHVWLWQHAGLPNDGNWLSEGLATTVELRLHPNAKRRRDWAELAEAGKFLPLQRLTASKPIASKRYWQACTLVEMLLADHPSAMPDIIRASAEGRSANHIVTQILRTNWVDLERRWLAYVMSSAQPKPTTGVVDRGSFEPGVSEIVSGKKAEAANANALAMQADDPRDDCSQHGAEKTFVNRSGTGRTP